ncbi:hypothetical protein ACYSNW_03235 [Enterococcus sp. LJL99]
MTKVTIENGKITIQLEGMNKILALKSEIIIPLENVQSVDYIENLKTSDYLGWWTPRIGLSIPGYAAEGTFFEKGERFFINIHQGNQGIILKVTDETYQEIVIELEDAETVYEEIKANLS